MKRWMVAGVSLAVLAVVAIGVQVHRVYDEGGELRITPSAAPPVIHEWGRDYRRSSSPAASSQPTHSHPVAETPGGGTVYRRSVRLPERFAHSAPVVVWVHEGSEYVVYELVGGP